MRAAVSVVAAAAIAIAPCAAASDVVEVAPLSALTPKAITLGKLLANPLLPALLLASLQQNLSTSYGKLRSDKPMFWTFSSRSGEPVPVLPCVEGIAQFTLNHPGATRSEDGSVYLLAAEGRPHEMVVVFDAADGYAAFALSSDDAKRALAETAASRRSPSTLSGSPIVSLRLGEEALAMAASSAAAIGTNRSDIASQVAGISAAVFLGDDGLKVSADVQPGNGASPESLCDKLDKSLGSSLRALGKSEGVRPACSFTQSAGKVHARISLPAAEMKKAGRAFNSAIVQSLATENPPGKKKGRK